MSPNRLHNGHTVKADDVYSFGVTIYVIWTGIEAHIAYWQQLQDDWTYRVDKVCDAVRPKLPEGLDITVALIRLMECWANNPAVRPPFSEVKVRIKKILDKLDEHNSHREVASSLASSTSPYDTLSRDDLELALEDTNLPKRPDKLIDVDAALMLYKQGARLGIPSEQSRPRGGCQVVPQSSRARQASPGAVRTWNVLFGRSRWS
ncbi:hypothetical protein M427DRAFT_357262 [Gonapodya prolifera JEL478]|uniref:Serine-threonine/tyrosine-protein kinase catalytic domain-containing protein n=1 Tax=Gonapodya prolifera (strain JEL478) TaxID=1344416 RepID=A0A139AB36_GONPJ|nr:hypothetical protein M427DRAFT_357262 [Gonapodya prolifera JEL478]|eukprot:KXS14041.1 hypothetical protein M427DRAFT_357262 [Gonapodya prolifera JEL478]